MSAFKLRYHFGTFATVADLPNAAGSSNVRVHLSAGCLAYVIATQQLVACTDPTMGSSSWVVVDASGVEEFGIAGQSNAGPLDDAVIESQMTGLVDVQKTTGGGTSLSNEWRPTADGGPGVKMTQWIIRLDAMTNPRAVLFYQGDGDGSTLEEATAYASRLRMWIAETRAHTTPWLPIFIPPQRLDGNKTYVAMLRAAHLGAIADDPFVFELNTDDVPGYDGLHYNAAGYAEIETRVAAAFDGI